jgi:predicted PurR-regulated permease PerM
VSLGVVGVVSIAVPKLTEQVRNIARDVHDQGGWNSWLDHKLRDGLGRETYERIATEVAAPSVTERKDGVSIVESGTSVSAWLFEQFPNERAKVIEKAQTIGKGVWTGVVYVFLTIIFSFMLVWGLPGIKKGLSQLEDSRISEMWAEVAPSIAQFGRLLGRAFEAQTMIAAVNTIITFVGMQIIGIPGAFVLSVPVFLCSFIPVAGVFISTAPIALVGLFMAGGGVGKFIAVVIMVTVAHVIEAYILNPRIYGHHMKMNPLAVLGILLIAEHSVGVWGLVIAIPLSTYVWRHVILGEKDDEVGGKHDAPAPAPPVAVAPPAVLPVVKP